MGTATVKYKYRIKDSFSGFEVYKKPEKDYEWFNFWKYCKTCASMDEALAFCKKKKLPTYQPKIEFKT